MRTHLHCSSIVADEERRSADDVVSSSDSMALAAGISAIVATRPGNANERAETPAKVLLFISTPKHGANCLRFCQHAERGSNNTPWE